MPVNDPKNIFVINPNFILYHALFIKYFWVSKTLLVSIGSKSTEKKFTIHFNPVFFFFLLRIETSFQILRKHSG